MYPFLCLLAGLLAYAIYIMFRPKKESLKVYDHIKYFSFSLTLSVLLTHLCIYILNGNVDMTFNFKYLTNVFVMKYIVLSVVVAFASAIIILLTEILLSKFTIKEQKNYLKQEKKPMIINLVLASIFFVLFYAVLYMHNYYSNVPAEQLMFHLQVPLGGTSSAIVKDIILKIVLPIVVSSGLLIFAVTANRKRLVLEFNKKKLFAFFPIKFDLKRITIGIIISIILLLAYFSHKYNIVSFVKAQFVTSSFIEDHYVNPKNVNMTFPSNKKNLIYIYVESLESSYMDEQSGGLMKHNLIPNLQELAATETNFSNNSGVGGFNETIGANWTIAGMVAQSSGLPLKFSADSTTYDVENESFLNGVVTLGDILKNNGYDNYLYLGSEVEFAGRNRYFEQHGNYNIFDFNSAKETGKIPEDYKVWWGFEDKKLFEYSREKLTELSRTKKPFNLTLLTVDTHPTGGYLDETCEAPYDKNIENVITCSDGMIIDFINWIKEQDFYDNTTVIITGDHLNMDSSFLGSTDGRYVYNAILNSSVQPINSKNRKATSFDMFPTTLASMGVEIEGDKLGLGVNLFSSKKTLSEEIGLSKINEELEKKSSFYQNVALYEE